MLQLQALERGKVLGAQIQKVFYYRESINELSSETLLHSHAVCYIDIDVLSVL